MSLTLGLTGMDPATEAALKAAFVDANARLNGHWQLLPEAEAKYVVVDMDSMYGPMSWLRLHAAGKRVIGLTTAPRTQTDFRLGRPFDGNQVAVLLREVATDGGVDLSVKAAGAEAAPSKPIDMPPETIRTASASEPPLAETGKAGSPATGPSPEIAVAPSATTAVPPPEVTAAPAPQQPLPETSASTAFADAPPPAAAPPPARDPVFADWLAPGALRGRFRYRRNGGAVLLIDAAARQYHGPAVLKPVAAYFDGVVRSEDFETLDDATWVSESAALGAPQPLQRLQWFGGLLAGKGELLPGHDAAGRCQLTKWPQTEREFPKHFRIATAMMKGPATLPDIATASGIPLADVIDFVNANLVTGFAEFVPEAPTEPIEPAKPTGLLGRLRGK
jgi:hypothetical protein